MFRHVASISHPLYRASNFWVEFNNLNSGQLTNFGLDNFKRSVNQNYYNWIPVSAADNQFRNVAKFWGGDPALDVLGVTLDKDADVSTAFSGNPLATSERRALYSLFVGLLWHFTRRTYANGLTDALSEPGLGNPLCCMLGARMISQDLANSIRERNVALSAVETELARGRAVSIVEIGAGYGRLGFVLLSSAPCRYTIVDIPPALALSQCYLTTLFPGKRAFRFRPWTDFSEVALELASSDICFMTPDQFALCPSNFYDIGITISSLSEMTQEQFAFYLSRLSSVVSGVIYTKQWIEHNNTQDGVIIKRSDYVLPGPWRLAVDRVDAIQDAFFEKLWLAS